MPVVGGCMWLYTTIKARLLFPLAVDEVEAFEPVQKKLKLDTDTESDGEKPHLDIGVGGGKSCDSGYTSPYAACAHTQTHSLLKELIHGYMQTCLMQAQSYKAPSTGIPVSGPPPASIITPHTISAT